MNDQPTFRSWRQALDQGILGKEQLALLEDIVKKSAKDEKGKAMEDFVVDLKARYQFMPHAAVELGIDNVGDYKYFLFHPFPQQTVIASLKATF